jgi:RTX calcium-binding nonapeptide repeat (4 copies)
VVFARPAGAEDSVMAFSDMTSLAPVSIARRFLATLVALCALYAAAGALPAEAAVTCNFNTGALTIQSSAAIDSATIVRSGDNIVVRDSQSAINCGTQATVHNTHVIAHSDNSGGESYFTIDLRGGPFTPGAPNEPGNTDEIDIQALMGEGDDRLYVYGGPGADFWRTGRTDNGFTGLNLNADIESAPSETPNSDVDLRDTELVVLMSGAGDDRVLAGGGPEFDGPLSTRVEINGEGGDDQLVGGNGPDHFLDGPGSDNVNGGAENDTIAEYGPVGEDDVFSGGPGSDQIAWADFQAPMRVDLRIAGRQDTGAGGKDLLTGFESATTSGGNDVLIGTDGDNDLDTGDGDDLVAGLGGADRIWAGPGNDTASYATPPAGVSQGVAVDLSKLGMDQDTGGAGVDKLDGVQNVIGSPFSDELTGNLADNRFEIRDGSGDRVTCAAGADTVVADVEGTDAINGECEAVQLDFRPDTRIDAAPASLTRDATPSFRFSATKQGATFECSLDRAAFGACPSEHTLARLRDGAHTLRVRSRDLLGALDLSPAERVFSIDTTRPRISRARVTGGRFGFRLSEKASVKIAIRGSKKATTVKRSGAALSPRILKALARGGRVTLTATDRAGNRSKPVRLRAV